MERAQELALEKMERDLNSTDREKEDRSGLPPITTSSASCHFDSVGKSGFFSGKKGSPDCAEELELRTPLTKKGKKIDSLSVLFKTVPLTETTDVGKLDMIEGLNTNNVTARISIPSWSENERWTDAGQRPSPTEPTPPALALGPGLETLSGFASGSLTAPNEAKDEAPATPKPWPAPSLTPASQSPLPAPAKTEPEKPLSLWERKKLKMASPPAPVSSLFSGGDGANSSGTLGDASGGRGNIESVVMPAIAGDRQSIFLDTPRDQKRENQRENVVEGFLGSNPARRRNDSAQSQITTKPTRSPAPAPQKASGWGSWRNSLLTNIASAVDDRPPSLEPSTVKSKIEDPPRRFVPSQPPNSQSAGFGSLNKPGWGTGGGSGDNDGWEVTKPGPTPIAQKTSAGPTGSPLGWGRGAGFGSGVGKSLTVDTTTKSPGSRLDAAMPESIPESAIEIKHLPAPGGFGGAITKTSRDPSPARENVPESQTALIEQPEKIGVPVMPAEDDEFDWASLPRRKKKNKRGNVASVSRNLPAPEGS